MVEGFKRPQAGLKRPIKSVGNGAMDVSQVGHGSIKPGDGFRKFWMMLTSHATPLAGLVKGWGASVNDILRLCCVEIR